MKNPCKECPGSYGPYSCAIEWDAECSKLNEYRAYQERISSKIECCDFGEHTCTVPVMSNGRQVDVDKCIADIVIALNAANIQTVASCCGHNKIDGSIVLKDGRELIITKFKSKYDHENRD